MIFLAFHKTFCPKCGRDAKELFAGLCLDCVLESGNVFFVPPKADAEQCTKCGKIKSRGKWVRASDDVFTSIIVALSSLKKLEAPRVLIKEIVFEDKSATVFVDVEGLFFGKKISVQKKVAVRLLRAVCPSCSRIYGNYFEAIVQARFEKGTPKKSIEEKLLLLESFFASNEEKHPLSKIVKTVFVSNGFDLVIGSKKAARKAAAFFEKYLKEKPKVSFKLHGWDLSKNRPMKRFTFSLRFK